MKLADYVCSTRTNGGHFGNRYGPRSLPKWKIGTNHRAWYYVEPRLGFTRYDNVQSAVDAEHHLIVAHDVVMAPTDRNQLTSISAKAKDAMGVERLDVLADRGYFAGEEILACEAMGVTPYVPKPWTSPAKAEGRFGKQDFTYVAAQNAYRCPAGNLLPHHMTTFEKGLVLHRYWDRASCQACALKPQCTPSVERRITRWEHEDIIEVAGTKFQVVK